jgi:hypothetical protein
MEPCMTTERSVWKNRTLLVALLCLMTGTSMAQGAEVTPLLSKDLTDIPGREVLMITVEKASGGADPYAGASVSLITLLPGNNAGLRETPFEVWITQSAAHIPIPLSQGRSVPVEVSR